MSRRRIWVEQSGETLLVNAELDGAFHCLALVRAGEVQDVKLWRLPILLRLETIGTVREPSLSVAEKNQTLAYLCTLPDL